MDRNNVHPIPVSVNIKFLNCLKPEWSNYVTMVPHNQTRDTVSYDVFYDSLVEFEQHVLASKAKKPAKNHDPLALLAHLNASSSQFRELQKDSQEDKLITVVMLLPRAITQKFSTPTNNRLRTLSNTRYQAVVQDGRVDIQTKNVSYGENGSMNAGRQNMNQAEEIMEELTAIIMLMARIQSVDDNAKTVPSYDAKAVSEVNASSNVHEQKKNNVKARSMLLMALPNEHKLTFSQYKDAKTLFESMQARFGGNDVIKKTQRTLLKQMYENFNAPSTYTNNINTTSIKVSVVRTPVSTVSSHHNTANLSDATVYAFLANQPNKSQLVHEDLEQIHEDDLEEMDLKRQLALLSMRAKRYFQRTGKKITINESDIVGYDRTKVLIRATWLMMKFQPTWQLWLSQNQRIEFNKSEFDLATYKRGLASIKEQLVFYKKNEVVFCDQVAILKRDALFRDLKISALNLQIEKLKKEKESNQIKIDNFENASKSLDKFIGSQITDNSRTGLGFTNYNAIVPQPTSLFAPLTIDLSNSGLEEFQHPEFKGCGPKDSKSVYVDT
nr:ribonuclease H-like domain-containing protein [Tanacetum cinerariifolium]